MKPTKPSKFNSTRSQDFRNILFFILAVLFFYPFLSQCIHNWAPARIGETIATADEWAKVEAMCTATVNRLAEVELWILAVCEITASMTIFIFTIWLAICAGARTMLAQDRDCGNQRRLTAVLLKMHRPEMVWKRSALVRLLLLLAPTVLSGPLLWCIFRLRSMHSVALENLGSDYTGNEWGFGQVVGIIIFAPVVTDMTFAAWAARSMLATGRR